MVFQVQQSKYDRRYLVIWDTQVPRARVRDKTPKVKVVYGPSRYPEERHLPADYGTNWGPANRLNGTSLRDIRSGRAPLDKKPPPYSEK